MSSKCSWYDQLTLNGNLVINNINILQCAGRVGPAYVSDTEKPADGALQGMVLRQQSTVVKFMRYIKQ